MKHVPLMKSEMVPFPYSVSPDDSVAHARSMMDDHGIRHLPVKEADNLVGVLGYGDTEAVSDNVAKVRDVYVSGAYVVDLNERLDSVLLAMADRHLDCVLITKNGHLAGIFTQNDVCRSYGQYLRHQFPTGGGSDAA